jgi:hypothetical protein
MVDEILIGLSLSSCIRQMANGEVDPAMVKCIIAGTNWKFPEDVDTAIEHYSESIWRECAEKAGKLLRQLVNENRIIQPRKPRKPRNFGFEALNTAHGHWAIQTNQPHYLVAFRNNITG